MWWLRISLCLLLMGVVAPSWAADFTESFTCADNASLTCDLTWTELVGTDWQIISNNAVVSGNTGFDQAFPTSLMTTDNQYAEGVLQYAPNGTNNLNIVLECQRHVSADTRYSVSASTTGAARQFDLARVVAGSSTTLATDPQDPADGDTIRLECALEGADMRLRVYVNTILLISHLDTTSVITGNRRTGISAFSDGAGQTGGWKSLAYGDYVAPTCRGAIMLLGAGGC